MKKLFLLIICVVLSIGARAQFSGSGNGTAADPYRIYTDIHFAQMANFLNQEGVVFELMKDVDLSSYISENSPSQGWNPIGVESAPFKGVLKGNGHTISGLMINRPANNNIGLFGYMAGATVNDLTIKATSITGSTNVGTLVGNVSGTTFTNCTVKVSAANGVKASGYLGGIVGRSSSCTFTNCDYEGNITATGNTGYAGGVVGYASSGSLADCDVAGTVNAKAYCGGVAGALIGVSLTNINMNGTVTGTSSIGGIVGIAQNSATWSNVNYYGDITGTENVAGIAGELATSSIVTFASCFSKGKITNSGDYTGGIVGKSNGICINSMDDCSHFGDIKGQNYVGGLVGAVLKIDAAAPTTSTYQIRNGSSSGSTVYATYSDQIVTGGTTTRKIYNCTAIGNIEGNDYVGGLVGESLYASSYTSSSSLYTFTYTYSGNKYLWKNGVYVSYKNYDRSSNGTFYYDFPRTIYTKGISTISLLNSYYSGNISAAKYVGGLIGHKVGGDILNCYTYSTINGSQNVGGIAGFVEGYSSTQYAVIKSTVANNASVTASAANVGRIYGASGDYITIGALASAEGNRALVQTKVMLSGIAQDVVDDKQNGTSVGPSMLKLKANYVSWGWNFDDNWNILETESYPYKKYQAAPPVIESTLQSHDTSISGKSVNGGTVYMYYRDREAVSTECDGYNWQFTTEELQSGAQVQLYADVDGMTPSYLTTSTVKYPGSGTEDDPYRIYTAEDLQGATNSGYYKLMNDIDLTAWINENSPEKGWPAIGRNSTVATYINGDGHKVTGLWINTTEGYNGLFSNYSAGYIKNLTVEVAKGKKVKGGDYTGILIGRMFNGEIVNCNVKGDVEGTVNVGGLAGYVENSTLTSNAFDGSVSTATADAYIAGITGHAKNVITTSNNTVATITSSGDNVYVGGLFGHAEGGSVSKCYTNITLNATGNANSVGGLIATIDAPVSQSYSCGTVTATGNDSYTGGLVGVAYTSIQDCYSTAKVTGTQFTAGLVAYTFSTVDRCYAKGDVKGVMYGAGLVGELDGAKATTTNSVAANNKLDLTAQSAWGCRVIGGFKNGAAEPTLGSNYALNTMQVSLNGVPQKKTDDNIEGVAKIAAELMSSATYTGLNWDMSKVWSIDDGEVYPYLLWEVDVNPVVDVTLDKTSLVLASGNTATLTATVMPLAATNKRLAWTSSNTAIATVENGEVTAVGIGTATITATSTDGSNISASCNVTVVANHDEAIAELRSLVDDALAMYNNSTEGDEIGQYQSGARAALLAVINEVRSKINDTMDESEISECTSKLNTAIDTFKSQQVSAGADTDITLLDNVIYVEPFEAASGQSVTLSVKMKNSASIQGYQFDLYLPEGVTVATDEDGFALAEMSTIRTTKNKTDYFGCNFQKDGALRVLCGSTKGYTFSGNDGEVCNITLNIAEGLDEGELPIILKNVTTTSNTNVGYDTPYVKTTLTVSSFTLGDVNSDTQINITDFTSTANYILGYEPAKFVKKAADFNTDNIINVTDLMALANYILSGGPSYAPKRLSAPRMAASASDNYIYVEPLTALRGGQATISVKMKNTENIQGYQLDMYLPEGITFATDADGFPLAEMSTERTTTQKTDYFGCNFQTDGALRLLCGSTKGYTFSGNDGEVARVTINVADDAQLGDLPLILRTLTVTTNQNVGYDTPSYETTITVKSNDVEYAEGYSLQILPFESNASTVHELVVNFNQKEENIEEMEFDVIAPECMSRTKSGRASKAPVFCNDERIYEEDHSISMTATDNGFKVVVKALTNDEYRVIAGTEGSLITLFYTSNSTAEDGLYKFQIKNIKMTTTDGDVIDVVPYTASVLMGEPVLEGDVEMYGNYSASATMAIANKVAGNVGVTSIDMSEITAINKRSSLALANPNAVVYLPEGMSISNTKNVISGTNCPKLVLADGVPFSTPKAFVAGEVSYSANVSASLGYKTLVLPYDSPVPAGFEAYEVGSVSGGELQMEKVMVITANKPVILKNAGVATMAASNVTIGVTDGYLIGGELIGTYEDITAPVGSYVLQNHGGNVAFYQVGEGVQPKVGAFRAYLAPQVAGAKMISVNFGDVATGIDEFNAGEADEAVYNVAGQRVSKAHRGVNVIRGNDGVKKVYVK